MVGESARPINQPAVPVPKDGGVRSIPPLRDQPAALVGPHLELFDRLLDRPLGIRHVVHDADEFRGRAFEMVDGPGMSARLHAGWFRFVSRRVSDNCENTL